MMESVALILQKDNGSGTNTCNLKYGGLGTVVSGYRGVPSWGENTRDWVLYHLIEQLTAERERADALAAFAREAFATAFDGGTWDGADIQEKGAELGLLREEPFDPEKHPGVDATDFEPGETIYVFTELMEGSGA